MVVARDPVDPVTVIVASVVIEACRILVRDGAAVARCDVVRSSSRADVTRLVTLARLPSVRTRTSRAAESVVTPVRCARRTVLSRLGMLRRTLLGVALCR